MLTCTKSCRQSLQARATHLPEILVQCNERSLRPALPATRAETETEGRAGAGPQGGSQSDYAYLRNLTAHGRHCLRKISLLGEKNNPRGSACSSCSLRKRHPNQ